ncbi:hypothetical protein HN587_06905 [Candidatus Woesearchaeota archaeon]|jgi:hypothetical protein|nr:hypothetical protein [Candidatus Woesearchaeota archaeon]
MKKSILFYVIALLLVSVVSATSMSDLTSIGNWAHLKTTMISQDPDPAEPGSYIELRWMVENLGGESADNVEFQIVPEFPFSTMPGSNPIKNLGSLGPAQLDDDKVILYYKLLVSEDAVEGTNKIKLRFRINGGEWSTLDSYAVRIQSVDAAVMITSAITEPKEILPGQEFSLQLKIKNLADSLMKDITIDLDLFYATLDRVTTTQADAYYEALPFAPIGSSAQKRIVSLKPGQEVLLDYNLIAYPTAMTRVYKLPIQLTYSDEQETSYSKEDLIGVIVNAPPELIIDFDSSSIVKTDSKGNVIINFINKGVSDIKFVYVTIGDSEKYDVLTSSADYIGNIDSDDYESSEFEIYLKNLSSDRMVTVPVEVTFKDIRNQEFSMNKDVTFKVHDEGKTKGKSNNSGLIIGAIIIIIVVFIAYRFWRNRQKRKKLEAE